MVSGTQCGSVPRGARAVITRELAYSCVPRAARLRPSGSQGPQRGHSIRRREQRSGRHPKLETRDGSGARGEIAQEGLVLTESQLAVRQREEGWHSRAQCPGYCDPPQPLGIYSNPKSPRPPRHLIWRCPSMISTRSGVALFVRPWTPACGSGSRPRGDEHSGRDRRSRLPPKLEFTARPARLRRRGPLVPVRGGGRRRSGPAPRCRLSRKRSGGQTHH